MDMLYLVKVAIVNNNGIIDGLNIEDVIQGFDINVRDTRDTTPLIQSVECEEQLITEFLLKHAEIDVNIKNNAGDTALSCAVEKGCIHTIRALLNHAGIKVNDQANSGKTPLIHAVCSGNKHVVELLLSDDKVNVNIKDRYCCTPFDNATKHRKWEIVELLLEHQKIVVEDKDLKVIMEIILTLKKAVKENGETIDGLNTENILQGFDVNTKDTNGNTALIWLVFDKDSTSIISLLLSHPEIDANIRENNEGSTALIFAVKKMNCEAIRIILKHPSTHDIKNNNDFTALDLAKIEKRQYIIDLLLKHSKGIINPNLQMITDMTGILKESIGNNGGVIDGLLVEDIIKDFNVNVSDFGIRGVTTLIQAVLDKDEPIVELLLKHPEINVNAQTNTGNTALICAVDERDCSMLKLLFKSNTINVNIQNNDGQTALIRAIYLDDEETFKILLDRADICVNIEDKNGDTALSLAKINNCRNKIILLLNHPKIAGHHRELKIIMNMLNSLTDATAKNGRTIDGLNVENILHGFNVNIKDSNGRTPLMWTLMPKGCYSSTEKYNIDELVAELLLNHPHIDVNTGDSENMTSLMYAIISHDGDQISKDIVAAFLNHRNIDVNLQRDDGSTALIIAAEGNKRETVQLLLEHLNIDVNVKDKTNLTAIDRAMMSNRNEEIIDLMSQHPGIFVNTELKMIIELLCSLRELIANNGGVIEGLDILNIVMTSDINVREESSGATPLIRSVIDSEKSIIELLLKHPDIDVNAIDINGDTSLYTAVRNNNMDITQLLVNHSEISVNIMNRSDRTALTAAVYVAVKVKDDQIMQLLLKHPGIEVVTAMHEAINLKDKVIVEMLLKRDDLNINYQDSSGITPLHAAIIRGNDSDSVLNDIIKMLIMHEKIDCDKRDIDGHSAFHVSVKTNYDTASKLILCNGIVNLNTKYKDGNSLLHAAVANANTEVVRMMVEYPSVKLLARKSKIAFDDLAEYEQLHKDKPVVDILLQNLKRKESRNFVDMYIIPQYKQYTADVNAVDADNNTPLHVAKNSEVIKQLLRFPDIHVNHLNSNNLSPLQLALNVDRPESVKLILTKPNVDVKRVDKNGNSLLHTAVLKNSPKTAEYLLQYTGITFSDGIKYKDRSRQDVYKEKFGDTDIWRAKYHENYEDNKVLVDSMLNDYNKSKIDLNRLNEDGDSALHIAICRHYYEIIILLATHHDINLRIKGKSGSSPFQLLVKNYPEIAKIALDKGLVVNTVRGDEEELLEYHIIMKLELIDKSTALVDNIEQGVSDSMIVSNHKNTENHDDEQEEVCIIELEDICTLQAGNSSETLDKNDQRNNTIKLRNLEDDDTYPLLDLAKQDTLNLELLTHPLVDAVLSRKWNDFGFRYFLILTLLYITYLFLLAVFVLTQTDRLIIEYDQNNTIDDQNITCITYDETTVCFEGLRTWVIILGYLLIFMSCIRLLWELLQLVYEVYRGYLKSNTATGICKGIIEFLLSFDNILELVVYSSCVYYVMSVLYPGKVITSVQWQVGACSFLFGWLNLLRALRLVEFKEIGLHIIMFFRIIHTFLTRIFFLLVFFIIVFTLLFYILMYHLNGLFNPFDSTLKVVTMWASGVSFEDYETGSSSTQIYSVTTFLALLLFVILVQVIFMNLATGLAIDDVKQIKRDAAAERNAQKIKYVYVIQKLHLRVCNVIMKVSILHNILREKILKYQHQPEESYKLEEFDITKVRPFLESGLYGSAVEITASEHTNELKLAESEIIKTIMDSNKGSTDEIQAMILKEHNDMKKAISTNHLTNETKISEIKDEQAEMKSQLNRIEEMLQNMLKQTTKVSTRPSTAKRLAERVRGYSES